MSMDTLRCEFSEQSAALRRQADRLSLELRRIDRRESKLHREEHALLSVQIIALHEAARQLLLATNGTS